MADNHRLVTTGPGNTPEQRRAASRLVLRHARSREDLRLLLNMLGLNQTPQPAHENDKETASVR